MTEQEAFLQAIIEAPDDDGPRLVYADWLDQRGKPGDAERAELIRVQCTLAALDDGTGAPPTQPNNGGVTTEEWWHLKRRERELLAYDGPPLLGRRTRFLTRPGDLPGMEEHNSYAWLGAGGYAMDWCTFRRGFIEAVECTAAEWLTWGERLLRTQPVTEVTFSCVAARHRQRLDRRWVEKVVRGGATAAQFLEVANAHATRLVNGDGQTIDLYVSARTYAEIRADGLRPAADFVYLGRELSTRPLPVRHPGGGAVEVVVGLPAGGPSIDPAALVSRGSMVEPRLWMTREGGIHVRTFAAWVREAELRPPDPAWQWEMMLRLELVTVGADDPWHEPGATRGDSLRERSE